MSLIGVFHRYTYIFHGYSGISVVFQYFGDSCDPFHMPLLIFYSSCFSTTDRAEDVAKITQELGPLIENVDYMEDKLTMEAKLNQALKVAASISPGVVQRPRRGSAVRKESDSEADESMDEDDSYEEKAPLTSTPAVHSEFLRHLTAEKSGLVFEDITDVAEEVVEEEDRRSFKEKFNAYDMDLSMVIISLVLLNFK